MGPPGAAGPPGWPEDLSYWRLFYVEREPGSGSIRAVFRAYVRAYVYMTLSAFVA